MDEDFIAIPIDNFLKAIWAEKREFSNFEAWFDLIQCAATEKHYTEPHNRRPTISVTVDVLSSRWMWSKSRVEKFLDRLSKDKLITTDKQHGMRVITLCRDDNNYKLSQTRNKP